MTIRNKQIRTKASSGKTAMHRENQHRHRLLRKVRQRWAGKMPPGMDTAAIPALEKYVRSLDRGPEMEWMGRRGVLPKFHGGCHRCMYFEANWGLPDLNYEGSSEYRVDLR